MNFLKGRQGVGAGSLYVAGAFGVSGVLTFVFQGMWPRFLGKAEVGDVAVLWSMVFLTVQVLWIGISQTLGRYLAEREARGEDWGPVVLSVRRLQLMLLAVFLFLCLLVSPLLTRWLFHGSWPLTIAFLAAVATYAPEYFRRGTFGGQRQFARLGALHIAESSSRLVVSAVLLVLGVGVIGPAIAIVLAPLIGVIAVRPTPETPHEEPGESFSAVEAFRFAGPVLLCVACAQAIMNGGPILITLIGGADAREQAGLLLLALVLARAPQYILSPAIAGLLPQASRILTNEGPRALDRFVGRAAAVVGCVGVAMVAGVWLLGAWAMPLIYTPDFAASREVLVALATLAAFYLMSELLNQALFARGQARLAALGWFAGLPVTAVAVILLRSELLERVSYSLALGAITAAVAQAAFYLVARRSVSERGTT